MPAKTRSMNGYTLIYKPSHPKALKGTGWQGYVYEHILEAEKMLNRALLAFEVVHHLDGNRSNNNHDNLLVLSQSQHMKLHKWLDHVGIKLDNGTVKFESLDRNRVNSGKSKVVRTPTCKQCSKPLTREQKSYCSTNCVNLSRINDNKPPKEVLATEITQFTWVDLGKKYNVSDNAVRKWAKGYGLL